MSGRSSAALRVQQTNRRFGPRSSGSRPATAFTVINGRRRRSARCFHPPEANRPALRDPSSDPLARATVSRKQGEKVTPALWSPQLGQPCGHRIYGD